MKSGIYRGGRREPWSRLHHEWGYSALPDMPVLTGQAFRFTSNEFLFSRGRKTKIVTVWNDRASGPYGLFKKPLDVHLRLAATTPLHRLYSSKSQSTWFTRGWEVCVAQGRPVEKQRDLAVVRRVSLAVAESSQAPTSWFDVKMSGKTSPKTWKRIKSPTPHASENSSTCVGRAHA